MEDLSAILRGFPPQQPEPDGKKLDTLARQHISSLVGAPLAAIGHIETNPAAVLALVNPAENSIGHLFVLEKILGKWGTLSAEDQAATRDSIRKFMLEFSAWQVRFVGRNLLSLFDVLNTIALFPSMETTELLAKAISRIDPSGSMFTSTHFMLAKFAFDNDSAEPALPIINRPVTAFPDMDGPKETAPLSSQDIPPSSFISKTTGLTQDVTTAMVLEYYHYCARIYISRREWQNALKSLERIITHPTKDRLISKLMLDGYRKWTLVGLLCNGCKPTMPSCVSGPTKNLFSTLAPRYGSLAGLYGSDDAITIKEDIEKNMASWREDGNEALINEVLIAYQPWQILNLRLVYRQVPVSQVQEETTSLVTGKQLESPEEVISLVQSMIDSGMLKGEIKPGPDAENTFILFVDIEESLTEAEFAREVARSCRSVELLGNDYQITNERLSGNKDYIKHMTREQGRPKPDGSDGGFDVTVEEEDLMTGILSHG